MRPPRKNILWKTPIPGLGHSSPRLSGATGSFLHGAIQRPQPRQSSRFDCTARIGSVKDETVHRWDRVLPRQAVRRSFVGEDRPGRRCPWFKRPSEVHPCELDPGDRRPSRPSLSSGPKGCYCFDMDGKEIWKKGFWRGSIPAFSSRPDAQWGVRPSSPLIVQDVTRPVRRG